MDGRRRAHHRNQHEEALSGLYASGMAANNVQGGFRMGPIFGGMFKSGRLVAKIIAEDLGAK